MKKFLSMVLLLGLNFSAFAETSLKNDPALVSNTQDHIVGNKSFSSMDSLLFTKDLAMIILPALAGFTYISDIVYTPGTPKATYFVLTLLSFSVSATLAVKVINEYLNEDTQKETLYKKLIKYKNLAAAYKEKLDLLEQK